VTLTRLTFVAFGLVIAISERLLTLLETRECVDQIPSHRPLGWVSEKSLKPLANHF
jgi:hypothetical protein